MRPITIASALCLTLALTGCEGGSTLEIRSEQWCAASAHVDLINTGMIAQRYAG